MKEYYRDQLNCVVELDECPFCGYNPEIRYLGHGCCAIRCTNPSCRAEQAVYSSLSEAAWRWNRRA